MDDSAAVIIDEHGQQITLPVGMQLVGEDGQPLETMIVTHDSVLVQESGEADQQLLEMASAIIAESVERTDQH